MSEIYLKLSNFPTFYCCHLRKKIKLLTYSFSKQNEMSFHVNYLSFEASNSISTASSLHEDFSIENNNVYWRSSNSLLQDFAILYMDNFLVFRSRMPTRNGRNG